MTVRCKMRCETKTLMQDGANVLLYPVTGASLENEMFYKWPPGGRLELCTIILAAAEQFIPGKEYYIDISPAEATAAATEA